MFNDLKGLASNEETYKFEIGEFKDKRVELESILEDL